MYVCIYACAYVLCVSKYVRVYVFMHFLYMVYCLSHYSGNTTSYLYIIDGYLFTLVIVLVIYACMYVSIYVFVFICTYVCVHACMYVRTYMHAHMYVYMTSNKAIIALNYRLLNQR
jgi:hypothetical protein